MKKNIELEESNIKSFKQLIKTPRKSVIARSEKQSDYIKALKENDMYYVFRTSRNWKKFFSSFSCCNNVNGKKIERVILSRPAVEAGEKLGFLPG